MLTLWIDTHDQKKVQVALEDGNQTLEVLTGQNEFGSQVLLTLIRRLLNSRNKQWRDLKAVKLNIGPGSFTGLKVGAAVANALGYTLQIPVNGKMIETDLNYS